MIEQVDFALPITHAANRQRNRGVGQLAQMKDVLLALRARPVRRVAPYAYVFLARNSFCSLFFGQMPHAMRASLVCTDEQMPTELISIEEALENSPDCVAVVDLEGQLVYMNSPGSWIMGVDSETVHNWAGVWPTDVGDLIDYSLESARSGRASHFVARRPTSQGSARWWDVTVSPVFGPGGTPERMLCVARDVTELKNVESSLKDSLSARETLLLETHHRVKNNLSTIAGLLRLQASRCESTAQEQLLRAAARIGVVAELHRHLSDTAAADRVDAGACVEQVANAVVHALAAEDQFVLNTRCVPGIQIAAGHALPLALIVGELVTNAVRHAFPAGAGTVAVGLTADASRLVLQIDDDGRGLPADFDTRRNSGLGMRIVNTLVSQLHGELSVGAEGKRGTHFRIAFETAYYSMAWRRDD